MKNGIYLILIALLAVAVAFLAMERRAGHNAGSGGNRAMMDNPEPGKCPTPGAGASRKKVLFELIKNGSSDTAKIFEQLEGLIAVQRANQKAAILRIIQLRDSLTGTEREEFLNRIDRGFCGNGRGMGMGMGMGQGRHGKGKNRLNQE